MAFNAAHACSAPLKSDSEELIKLILAGPRVIEAVAGNGTTRQVRRKRIIDAMRVNDA